MLEQAEENPGSIKDRREIKAPPNYVSVFHETKKDFLEAINQEGLRVGPKSRNIGSSEAMARRNKMIDDHRPRNLIKMGISRISCIYAYPFLECGHGLIGADQRFIRHDPSSLREEFEHALRNRDIYKDFLDYWSRSGVNTPDEYVARMTDPEFLRIIYPGEILELRVDPERCWVGDLEYITRIGDGVNRGLSEAQAAEHQAPKYWKNLITLEDFLKWYRKPAWAEDGNSIKDAEQYRDGEPLDTGGYYPLRGAPDSFPWRICQPEILIPENVPQEQIRLVK